jgi:hypothetical protein
MEDQGTPARDHHEPEEFEKQDDAVSDQQGETGPPAAGEPKDSRPADDDEDRPGAARDA